MSHRTALFAALLAALPAFAQSEVKREVIGNRTSENIPAIPAELIEQLNRSLAQARRDLDDADMALLDELDAEDSTGEPAGDVEPARV